MPKKGSLQVAAERALKRGAYAEQVIRITGNQLPEVDWQTAELYIEPAYGCTYVEMAPIPKQTGGLFVGSGEGGEWRNRPDFGTVIAVSPFWKDEKGREHEIDLRPGEVVAIDHEHGKRIEGAVFGPYEAIEEVRIYGRAAQSGGRTVNVPWYQSILGSVDTLNGRIRINPKHDWVYVERDAVYEKSEGGIWIPDSVTHRSTKGTVVAVGSAVEAIYGVTLQRGDRVCYMANTVKRFSCPGVDTRNLVALRGDDILGAIYGEELTQSQIDALPFSSKLSLGGDGNFPLIEVEGEFEMGISA